MQNMVKMTWLAAAGVIGLAGCASNPPGPKGMTFFVTSTGPGQGGDLGGLEGADRHCQTLAQAAGAGDRTWRAYLSTQAPKLADTNFVNARDRIGKGPWQNAKGEVIAQNVRRPAFGRQQADQTDGTGRKRPTREQPHGKAQQARHTDRLAG